MKLPRNYFSKLRHQAIKEGFQLSLDQAAGIVGYIRLHMQVQSNLGYTYIYIIYTIYIYTIYLYIYTCFFFKNIYIYILYYIWYIIYYIILYYIILNLSIYCISIFGDGYTFINRDLSRPCVSDSQNGIHCFDRERLWLFPIWLWLRMD